MSGMRMHLIAGYTRLVFRRRFATAKAGRAWLARGKDSPEPPRRIRRRHLVEHTRRGGFEVYSVRGDQAGQAGQAGQAAAAPAIVYLHGGGYVSEIHRRHWWLIAELAERSGLEVLVPIYGLAPAHHGTEARAFVITVLEDLRADGRSAYLVGDSAGGGLALIAARATADRIPGVVLGATLIAPWLDLRMSNPGIEAVEPEDPWLARPGLREAAVAWAADLPLEDPRVSPVRGDLGGLPPLQVLVGTRDITLPDCRLLRDRLPDDAPLRYHEEPGALHVYPLLPVPEARAGRDAILDHLREVAGDEARDVPH